MPNVFNSDSYYGSSLDPYGRTGFGTSNSGNLMSRGGGSLVADNTTTTNIEPTSGEFADNPYEIDPTGKLRGDVVYSADDLESVLRFDDFDGDQLTERLRRSSSAMIAANPDLKHALTTISKSDDRPILYGATSASAYSVLKSTLLNTLTDTQVKQLIAPEIRLGRKLDLNRRFGNGVDDSPAGTPGFGVVDEPAELFLVGVDDDGDGNVDEADEASFETEPFKAYSGATTPSDYVGVTANYDFDEASAIGPRQLFARHLYVMMTAVSQGIAGAFPSFGDTMGPPVPVSDRPAYTARRLAQWAVNVVDFRDADSIMTRFSYDPNPLDGWGVAYDINGDGTSDRFEAMPHLQLILHQVHMFGAQRILSWSSRNLLPFMMFEFATPITIQHTRQRALVVLMMMTQTKYVFLRGRYSLSCIAHDKTCRSLQEAPLLQILRLPVAFRANSTMLRIAAQHHSRIGSGPYCHDLL